MSKPIYTYYCYLIKCKERPDNNGYIGSRKTTEVNPENDYYYGSSSNKQFKGDFKRLGIKGFEKRILYIGKDREDVYRKEAELINDYKTLYPKGYNLNPSGGSLIKQFPFLLNKWIDKYGEVVANDMYKEYQKAQKVLGKGALLKRKSMKQILIDKYGDEEGMRRHKEMAKKAAKKRMGKNNPMYGRCAYDIWVEKYGVDEANKHREEANRKMKESFDKIEGIAELRKEVANRNFKKYRNVSFYKQMIKKYGEVEAKKRLKEKGRKQSELRRGELNITGKPCIFEGIKYPSIAEVARSLNMNYNVLHGRLFRGTMKIKRISKIKIAA